ncbi:hypothetical protein HAX54_041594 [Datura stramonium]|uniref:Uncharacterized protein n=1 Tax=Datura stramonium TaxID=4076 RepID=A0ABS8VX81_DATST|nr:hypothetical protein [Datura stramonium]
MTPFVSVMMPQLMAYRHADGPSHWSSVTLDLALPLHKIDDRRDVPSYGTSTVAPVVTGTFIVSGWTTSIAGGGVMRVFKYEETMAPSACPSTMGAKMEEAHQPGLNILKAHRLFYSRQSLSLSQL